VGWATIPKIFSVFTTNIWTEGGPLTLLTVEHGGGDLLSRYKRVMCQHSSPLILEIRVRGRECVVTSPVKFACRGAKLTKGAATAVYSHQ
jgi:hypothetical protein